MCVRRRVILSGGGPSADVSESPSFLSFFFRGNLSHVTAVQGSPHSNCPPPPPPEPSAS